MVKKKAKMNNRCFYRAEQKRARKHNQNTAETQGRTVTSVWGDAEKISKRRGRWTQRSGFWPDVQWCKTGVTNVLMGNHDHCEWFWEWSP